MRVRTYFGRFGAFLVAAIVVFLDDAKLDSEFDGLNGELSRFFGELNRFFGEAG